MGHFCFCFNRRQMSGTERRGSTPFLKFVVGGCQQCASGNIIEWVSLMNVLPIWLTGTIFSKNGAPSGCLWQLGRLLMRRINICFIFEKGKLCANLMSVRRLGGGEKKKKRSHLSLVEHECDGRQFVKVSVSCANAAVFFCYRLLVQVCAHPKLIITQQESVGGKKKEIIHFL